MQGRAGTDLQVKKKYWTQEKMQIKNYIYSALYCTIYRERRSRKNIGGDKLYEYTNPIQNSWNFQIPVYDLRK